MIMKKEVNKKIICTTLSFGVLTASTVLPIVAVTPTYAVSKYYKESGYYNRLLNYKSTGDERYDVLSIAITQLGYHEGNSVSDMGGGNTSGYRNFAEYNKIIGAPVDNGEGNGVSYGFEWCAAFISWCQRQARVPTSSVITEISCIRMLDWLRARDLYKSRSSGYSPQPADIVFFRATASSSRATHVGLYIGSDSTYIYTIEGNSTDRVSYQRYPKNSALILGYGTPNYKTVDGVKYDFELRTGWFEPGIYVTTDDLNHRTGPSTSYASLGKIPKGTKLKITEISGNFAKVNYNGKNGWSSLDYLKFSENIKYSVKYDANGGEGAPTAQEKEHGLATELSDKLPTREGHIFLGWSPNKNAKTPDYAAGAIYTKNGDVTLYAVFKYVGYTVSFYSEDGELISSATYDIGDSIEVPEAPEKGRDLFFKYEFAGWSPEIPDGVTGNAQFRATYKKISVFSTTESTTEPSVPDTEPDEPENTEPPTESAVNGSAFASAFAGIIGAIATAAAMVFVRKKN
ncbi:MAG: CHAP domain-containing protein [Ruminococcaceae bacterium]|nr:CHAP domain-containing protein [Oscillospiraceae bacterium]